jgi:hypothetical protein
MEELKDKDFDKFFKFRINEEIPEFEEESWSKMEKKLKKRDRLIFFRNASIILLFLSFGVGFYYANKKDGIGVESIASKKEGVKKTTGQTPTRIGEITSPSSLLPTGSRPITAQNNPSHQNSTQQNAVAKKDGADLKQVPEQQVANLAQESPEKNKVGFSAQNANNTSTTLNTITEQPVIAKVEVAKSSADQTDAQPEKIKKARRKFPISLAINAGPDFNSTTSMLGGKTNLAFGVGVGIGVSKKLSIQTGITYGHKNYNATANNYTFNNPNIKSTISEVNAACKVIEIPLRASLNINENQKRSIELNAGLSSYLMLKEHYVYKYTAVSGRADRLVDASNENQHILSVLELSGTYNIKLKNKKLAFGIEPYVKIPLTGIGEGSVPLKSSGISLKLRYDLNKK